jgi:hypothetical protein
VTYDVDSIGDVRTLASDEETIMRARLLIAAIALATSASSVFAQAQSSQTPCASAIPTSACKGDEAPPQLLGTWKLNVGKSKYSPGPPLREETRVYTRGADGVTGVVTRTYADGEKERYEYIANFGGEYMVTGNPAYDAVTLKRIDQLASEAMLTHAGMIYGIARRVISPDGKTMTITFDRKDNDRPVHNVAVYDKQP